MSNTTPIETTADEFRANFAADYDPAPESYQKQIPIKENYQLFIDGKFSKATGGKTFATVNPASEKTITKIADASIKDVDRAVKAARKAYKSWSKLSGSQRGRYLFRIARMIQERARELAVVETLDGGKPIKESRDFDLPNCAAHFFYHGGWADKLDYVYPGKKVKPIGVCAQVIPWNFPLLMAAWKIAPAIAMGNTVVLKPAETTSLSAVFLAEIFQQAGLPEGVVNIVTGGPKTGAALVAHPDVNKVAFTGSTDVGKIIMRAVSGTNKKTTMELGGKSANIIYEDAALDQAVEGIVTGIYFNQGHVCCAGSRLLVEESVAELVLKKLQKRMAQLRVGDPMDKNTDIGAINSKEQLTKIRELVAIGKEEGGQYWEPESCTLPTKGYFHQPCYFSGLSASATVNRIEIFGPVLAISTFRTPDEAVKKANDTRYGLSAGIWSEKASKIHWTAERLKAGVVWTNTYNKFDPTSPFGGFFESGHGREGGRHGLLPYVEVV